MKNLSPDCPAPVCQLKNWNIELKVSSSTFRSTISDKEPYYSEDGQELWFDRNGTSVSYEAFMGLLRHPEFQEYMKSVQRLMEIYKKEQEKKPTQAAAAAAPRGPSTPPGDPVETDELNFSEESSGTETAYSSPDERNEKRVQKKKKGSNLAASKRTSSSDKIKKKLFTSEDDQKNEKKKEVRHGSVNTKHSNKRKVDSLMLSETTHNDDKKHKLDQTLADARNHNDDVLNPEDFDLSAYPSSSP